MNTLALGECEWKSPHPPHLWAEELSLSNDETKIKLWACSGFADVDEG